MKTIFVGNLPYNITEEDLKEEFRKFGAVSSARVVMDRDTERSKGFGFVEMADDHAAYMAISGLDGQDIGGRKWRVNAAEPRRERTPYRGDRR